MIIQGKLAVIFGGARGIGKEYVKQLLENGAKVCLADIRTEEGSETEKEFGLKFDSCVKFVKCDVTQNNEIQNVFEKAGEMFNAKVEICVNSVGVVFEDEYVKMIEINFTSAVHITYTALEFMGIDKGSHGGVIIHTSSINAFRRYCQIPVYSGTKAAMVAFARSIAMPEHYTIHDVRINLVCPCMVMTDMQDEARVLRKELFTESQDGKPDVKTSTCAEAMIRLVQDDSLNGHVLIATATKGIISYNADHEIPYEDLW